MKQPISSEPTVKPRPPSPSAKACPQAVLGSVYRAAVIAEQKTADRRDRDDGADEAHIGPCRARFRHNFLPKVPRFVGALS